MTPTRRVRWTHGGLTPASTEDGPERVRRVTSGATCAPTSVLNVIGGSARVVRLEKSLELSLGATTQIANPLWYADLSSASVRVCLGSVGGPRGAFGSFGKSSPHQYQLAGCRRVLEMMGIGPALRPSVWLASVFSWWGSGCGIGSVLASSVAQSRNLDAMSGRSYRFAIGAWCFDPCVTSAQTGPVGQISFVSAVSTRCAWRRRGPGSSEPARSREVECQGHGAEWVCCQTNETPIAVPQCATGGQPNQHEQGPPNTDRAAMSGRWEEQFGQLDVS